MKSVIIRNGGWVTSQFDNVLESNIGSITGEEAKAQNLITTYRIYITVNFRWILIPDARYLELEVAISEDFLSEDFSFAPMK